MSKKKKLFVLDTNVIMHDWQCVFKFQENDIAVPFTVIQELDKHKTTPHLSYNVRNGLKFLSQFNGNIINRNNSIGEGLGNIFVSNPDKKDIADAEITIIDIHNNDDKIVQNALYLQWKYRNDYEKIILVTRDAAMRVEASSLKLLAEDYLFDNVQVDNLYKGKMDLTVDGSIVSKLYQRPGFLTKDVLPDDIVEKNYNQAFVLKSDNGNSSTALACFQRDKRDEIIDDTLVLVTKRTKKERRITIETLNAEQAFLWHFLTNPDITLVTVNGIAGTGKTLLSVLAGLEQAVIDKKYEKIIAMRPIMGLSGKEIGYLPGDEKEKIDPYMRPIYDNLDFIKSRCGKANQEKIKAAQEDKRLSVEAMTYVRGRTYNNTFLIIDEAQNLTPHEAKTLITRMGEGSKIVLAGDVFQTDGPYLNETSNGLAHVIDRFSKENYPFYAHITLEKGERSDLASIAAKIL